MEDSPKFKTSIWYEEAETDNPFLASKSYCHGYDVFGDLVGKASYSQYILTLFLSNKPTPKQTWLFDCLSIALANWGPRDIATRAAMNSGVGGAPAAANLMSFLSVASGNYQGSHELWQLVKWFHEFGLNTNKWLTIFENPNCERHREDIWEKFEHIPGFLPHAENASGITKQFLALNGHSEEYAAIAWLKEQLDVFEEKTGCALSLNFAIAAVFYELNFTPEKAELCYLVVRLPGAAVHSLEAKQQGWKQFPFFGRQIELSDDPGSVDELPDVSDVLK